MLLEHEAAAARRERLGEVEEAGVRPEEAADVRFEPGEQPVPEVEVLVLLEADVGGADLLAVADDDHAVGEPAEQHGLQAGLAGLVDDDDVEHAGLVHGHGLRDLVQRHDPGRHGGLRLAQCGLRVTPVAVLVLALDAAGGLLVRAECS